MIDTTLEFEQNLDELNFEEARLKLELSIEEKFIGMAKANGMPESEAKKVIRESKARAISGLKNSYIIKDMRAALGPVIKEYELKGVVCGFADLDHVGVQTYVDDAIVKESRVASSALLTSIAKSVSEQLS